MTVVLLDLEETMVDNWSDFNILPHNIEKVRSFLEGRAFPDPLPFVNLRLGIMSWAIWDQKDKDRFLTFQPHLEEALHQKFSADVVLSMDEWADEVFKFNRLKLDRTDMFDMFKKPEVLCALREKFAGESVYLIDDMVEHGSHFSFPKHDSRVQLMDIHEMEVHKGWDKSKLPELKK